MSLSARSTDTAGQAASGRQVELAGFGMTGAAACLPCELENSADHAVVFRDQTWSCEVAAGYDVPGWYILRVRRHAEGWEGLTPAELAGFGERSQQLSSAVKSALGASHVYFMSFGENYPHFHFLVTARDADTPPDQRGGNILTLRGTHRDWDSSIAALPGLRAALASQTESTSPTPSSSP